MNDEYISREAVLKHLNECRTNPLFDPEMARMCFAISVFIEDMQAADVQPVKHGRWKPVLYTSHCSCGKSYQTTFYNCSVCDHVAQWQPYGLNYCPNCGARMDGDTERRCEK